MPDQIDCFKPIFALQHLIHLQESNSESCFELCVTLVGVELKVCTSLIYFGLKRAKRGRETILGRSKS